MIFAVILIVIALGAHACVENNMMLRVRHEKLGKGLKIAHIADLHKRRFGSSNERLIGRVIAEKPDVILISGDLISRSCTDFSSAKTTLEGLCAIAPVYMVFGNHEADLSNEYKSELKTIVKKSGAYLLENETVHLSIGDRRVNISGLELNNSVYKKNGSYRNLDEVTLGEIKQKIGKKPEGETILLVHNPLFAKIYAEWGADYAVSGHVHGGAVCVPFTRVGVLSPERRFLPKYTKGVYTVGRMKLLLSGGLGKFRLFNPPEIVIYEL